MPHIKQIGWAVLEAKNGDKVVSSKEDDGGTHFTFGCDGRLLVTGTRQNRLHFFDIETGDGHWWEIPSFDNELSNVNVSADGKTVAWLEKHDDHIYVLKSGLKEMAFSRMVIKVEGALKKSDRIIGLD